MRLISTLAGLIFISTFGCAVQSTVTDYGRTNHGNIQAVNLDLITGPRGLAHTLVLRIEAIGESDTGDIVRAFADYDPPVPNGLPGGSTRKITVDFNKPFSMRTIKHFRLTVRGDRPEQNITTAWDMKRIVLMQRNGSLIFMDTAGGVLDVNTPAWTSGPNPRYDPSGRNSSAGNYVVEYRTGADGLARGTDLATLLVFKDGTTSQVHAGTLAANSKAQYSAKNPAVVRPINDLAFVVVMKNMYPSFSGAFGIGAYGSSGRMDSWDCRGIEVIGTLLDGSKVNYNFTELIGKHGYLMKKSTVQNAQPMKLRPVERSGMISTFVDAAGYPSANSGNIPDLNVSVQYQGSSSWSHVVGRRVSSKPNFIGRSIENSTWTVQSETDILPLAQLIRNGGRHSLAGTMVAPLELWQGERAIQRVKFWLTDSKTGSSFSGNAGVGLNGFWLGIPNSSFSFAGGVSKSVQTAAFYVDPIRLSGDRPEYVVDVSY